MRHTQAFVPEVLRLYPPAFMTAREAVWVQSIEGVAVRAGAIVLLPIWLQRRPELWAKADHFEPARFLQGPSPAGLITSRSGPADTCVSVPNLP